MSRPFSPGHNPCPSRPVPPPPPTHPQVFLRDLADFPDMNAAWDEWVPAGHAPSRATVEAKLADPGWRVEIVVTAAVPPAPAQ